MNALLWRRILDTSRIMKRFCGLIELEIGFLILYLSVFAERVACAAARNRLELAAHSNFVKVNYFAESKRHYVWCFKNASVCLDPSKNPGGGTTCCWNTFCQDTYSDKNHCGGCGSSCNYGLTCCYSKCTDLLNDRYHCGSCETGCPENEKCEFGMCGYGSGYDEVKQNSFNPKHW